MITAVLTLVAMFYGFCAVLMGLMKFIMFFQKPVPAISLAVSPEDNDRHAACREWNNGYLSDSEYFLKLDSLKAN